MGRDTTIESAGYRGVPNPEIRCSDLHLATAEDISLGLSLCGRQAMVVRRTFTILEWIVDIGTHSRGECRDATIMHLIVIVTFPPRTPINFTCCNFKKSRLLSHRIALPIILY